MSGVAEPISVRADNARGATSRRRWVLLVTSLAAFMALLDATIVNIAFPSIQASFPHISRAWLSWVLNGYNVVFAALLVPAGQLADLIGRRRVLLIGILVFTVSSLLCAIAPTVELLVAMRVLQAIGAALLVPASLALLLAEFPLNKRIAAIAMLGTAAAVAAAIGPSVGGLLVHASSWRTVFLVNLPLGVIAFAIGWRVVREQRDREHGSPPDVLAIVFLAAGVALIALALGQGHSWGWGDTRIVGSFVAAVCALGAFAQRSLRNPASAVELSLLRIASVRYANAAIVVFAAAFYGKILTDVLFLTSVWHYSVLTAGAALTPGPLFTAIFAFPAGRLASRFGVARIAALGALVYALGGAWYAFEAGMHAAYVTQWLPGTLLTGAGIALAFPTLTSAAVAALPASRYGSGAAVNATARQIGGVLGIAVVIGFAGAPSLAGAHGAFVNAWTFTAIAAAIAAAIAFLPAITARRGADRGAGPGADYA
jgi:EmrB/QacA subfamily drug resistance transporter